MDAGVGSVMVGVLVPGGGGTDVALSILGSYVEAIRTSAMPDMVRGGKREVRGGARAG